MASGFNFSKSLQGTQGSASWADVAYRLGNIFTGDLNYQRQVEQSEFNAEEAAKVREWQERMSNTAYQRAAADARAAGLNPYTMSTGGASTPSGSYGQSASAQNSGAGLVELLRGLFGLASKGIDAAASASAKSVKDRIDSAYKKGWYQAKTTPSFYMR